MGRLITPQPDEHGTPPGKAVFWTVDIDGNRIEDEPCSYAGAITKLLRVLKHRPFEVRRAVMNYKTSDGQRLDVIAIEMQQLLRQTSIWKSFYGLFTKGDKDDGK